MTLILVILLAIDPGKFTCLEVKAAVKIVGKETAERMARSAGATDAMIEKWGKCLIERRHPNR
jgi:hypothetical protein